MEPGSMGAHQHKDRILRVGHLKIKNASSVPPTDFKFSWPETGAHRADVHGVT